MPMKTRREASGSGGRDLNNDSVMRHKIKIFRGNLCVCAPQKSRREGEGHRDPSVGGVGELSEKREGFFYCLHRIIKYFFKKNLKSSGVVGVSSNDSHCLLGAVSAASAGHQRARNKANVEAQSVVLILLFLFQCTQHSTD